MGTHPFWRVWFAAAASFLAIAAAYAHQPFSDYVERRFSFEYKPPHLDMTVDIRWHGSAAWRLRESIDADGDHSLDKNELRMFLSDAFHYLDDIDVSHEDEPLKWVELHAPRLDINNAPRVTRTAIGVRLFAFARVEGPAEDIAVDYIDRMAPDLPAAIELAGVKPENENGVADHRFALRIMSPHINDVSRTARVWIPCATNE